MNSNRKSGSVDNHSLAKDKRKKPRQNISREDNSLFKCSFCNFTTTCLGQLTPHIRVHTREKPYKCQHGNRKAAFSYIGNLKRHKLVHNKPDESSLKFKCSTCSYKTGCKQNLVKHLRIHSDVKDFACELCPYRANNKQSITSHHQRIHCQIEKLFKCSHPGCKLSFKQRPELTRHLKVHSSDHPFACSVANCNFKTKWKGSLKNHKMKHRGEKPFKCTFCPYASNNKTHLVTHTRVHTGETPYACQNCSYRTSESSNLNRHRKLHHMGQTPRDRSRNAAGIRVCKKIVSSCQVVECDFSTRKDSALAIHLNEVHSLPRVTLTRL